MRILEKDPNKVEVKTETNDYEENFNSKLIQEDEVDLKMNNILNDYNLVEAFTAETEKPKQILKEQSIHKLLADYADIVYSNMKELAKTNII